MTWSKLPKQSGFGELDFTRWTDTHSAPVKAKDKLPSPPMAPVSRPKPKLVTARPAIAASQDDSQWRRMWQLKAFIRQRVAEGCSHDQALAEGKRRFWPEEFQGEN